MRSQRNGWVRFAAFVLVAAVWAAGAVAMAQGDEVAAPEITNPAIRQILQSRTARVRLLNRHKAAEILGENNKALVEVRNLSALPLQDRAAVQKLVKAENADRELMLQEMAQIVGGELPEIRSTYATTLREKARPGDWIQRPDGRWEQKLEEELKALEQGGGGA